MSQQNFIVISYQNIIVFCSQNIQIPCRTPKLQTASNSFLINLLIADCMLLLNCYPHVVQTFFGTHVLGKNGKICFKDIDQIFY